MLAQVTMPTPRAKALMSLFKLKYPILEAPHGLATGPDLTIAVSNAGAMGSLALTGRSSDQTRTFVSNVRVATKGAFFVNYILREEPASLKVALDAGAPIVQLAYWLHNQLNGRCWIHWDDQLWKEWRSNI
jgi:NAD(P)H-dependent flavin oxidoreductase YrpB (nitropropane dioxygenase family)